MSITNRSRDYERELSLVMTAIAESVAQTPADVLWVECREDGIDTEAIARHTKTILAEAVKRQSQQKLRRARSEYETHVAAMQHRVYSIPESIQKQRELLASVFSMKPELQGVLTAAARDFQQLTDNDVELTLKQLQELGALDDLFPKDNHL